MNQKDFFLDKVVAITGGTDGIGKALVESLIPLGSKISTCARNPEKLNFLAEKFPNSQLLVVKADVSIQENCKDFIDNTIAQFGKIDILINNAGISMRSLFEDADPEVIKRVMDINFMGAVYCTHYALQSIIANKGSIVGISSIAGYRGLPGRSGYSASKFALNGWLEALRTELSTYDVNVLWVSPGFTKSNIRNAALNGKSEAQGESPLNESELMTSEACASHIMNAIYSNKRTLILGFQGKQTVWLNKLFPSLTDKLIRKFFFKNGKLIK
jgi:short-subunit dehydrogenase